MAEGHHSSTGRCFDIGSTVLQALADFSEHGDPDRSGASERQSAGNGSLMRLAPVPLVLRARSGARDRDVRGQLADDARASGGGGRLPLLRRPAARRDRGPPKDTLLAPRFSPVPESWSREPLAPAIAEVAGGSFLEREPPQIQGTGYVTRSLEAALWAFPRTTSFERGALMAVNLGDDADTTGAIYGQLAGAFYGVDAIPSPWRNKLALRETIESMARRLLER